MLKAAVDGAQINHLLDAVLSVDREIKSLAELLPLLGLGEY
jgi:hypothetical protein